MARDTYCAGHEHLPSLWQRLEDEFPVPTPSALCRVCSLTLLPPFRLTLVKQPSRRGKWQIGKVYLSQRIQGVAGSQAVLWERRALGAPPVLTSLFPDPTISWGWVPRAFLFMSPAGQRGPSAPPRESNLWPGMALRGGTEGGRMGNKPCYGGI